jgi:hypothetical protein
VYCSDQAHSSIDKAVLTLGLGQSSLRRIAVDDQYSMRPDALRAALDEDRRAGIRPVAVVATIGTTSTTGIDPVNAIADICRDHRIWLHVDAAYAGVAAMLPGCASYFAGWDRADSIVINPHKWLFTPFDLSAFYCRRMEVVREAFSLVPEYLKTPEASEGARNLMDTVSSSAAAFRSLKLWMVLRHFGAARLRTILAEHIRLAHEFAARVDEHPDFERLAACAVWRRVLPRKPRALATWICRTRPLQPAPSRCGERNGRGVFVAHAHQRRVRHPHRDRPSAHDRRAHASRVGTAAAADRRARCCVEANGKTRPLQKKLQFCHVFDELCGSFRAPRLHPAATEKPRRKKGDDTDGGGTQMLKKCALIAALLLVIGPASARADWLFTPNIGVGFGGDTPSNDKLTYGATLGWMGAGIVGFEADWSYTPTFFENSTENISFADSDNVQNLMANIVLGIPVGGQKGPGLPPVRQWRLGIDEDARRRRGTAVHNR